MRDQQILQPETGPIRARHYLPADARSILWGRLPCALDLPVLTVDPGDEVTIDTISHEGIHEDQGRDPRRFFGGHGVPPEAVLADAIRLAAGDHDRDPSVDGPHVVTGPIAVRGAEPGDVLTMTVIETLPRVPYGVISNRHARGALPDEFPRDGDASHSVFASVVDDVPGQSSGPRGRLALRPGSDEAATFALAPFLGIMGVAVAGGTRPHSVPPGLHGGNLDIRLLIEGAALHLPVQVPGALAYVGDPHFAQGDGEVALTAMEASLRVTVRFELTSRAEAVAAFGEQVGPLAETSEFLIPTGLDEDLDEAVRKATRAAITLLVARHGMDPRHAYAYLSAATDFRISQVVDIVKGVHATIRKGDFA